MWFHRRGECIQPVRRANEVFQGIGWRDIFDPERNDRYTLVDRALDLPLNLCRGIGICRKDQHHGTRAPDGFHDRAAPIAARNNIARRDPAADAVSLQNHASGIGYLFVLQRIANEYVVRHCYAMAWERYRRS